MLGADVSEYPLRPCNHEEFDTRVMLHAANAVSHGYKRILIIAGKNTGIIVQGISFFIDIGADKCGFRLELEKNCRTFQFMTSTVGAYDVFRQGKSSSRIPCPLLLHRVLHNYY